MNQRGRDGQPGACIPNACRAVEAAGRQQATVAAKRDAQDASPMVHDRGHRLAGHGVPDPGQPSAHAVANRFPPGSNAAWLTPLPSSTVTAELPVVVTSQSRAVESEPTVNTLEPSGVNRVAATVRRGRAAERAALRSTHPRPGQYHHIRTSRPAHRRG